MQRCLKNGRERFLRTHWNEFIIEFINCLHPGSIFSFLEQVMSYWNEFSQKSYNSSVTLERSLFSRPHPFQIAVVVYELPSRGNFVILTNWVDACGEVTKSPQMAAFFNCARKIWYSFSVWYELLRCSILWGSGVRIYNRGGLLWDRWCSLFLMWNRQAGRCTLHVRWSTIGIINFASTL